MARAWQTLDRVETDEGLLELRQRGESSDGDFLIVIAGRVLMNSRAHRSEVALAEVVCEPCSDREAPSVLIGGLGMGLTLRAALDGLGDDASVHVSELNPVVLEWCRGPLAELTDDATRDGRATVAVEDVAERIRSAATKPFDAIAIDLYEGPSARADDAHPLYGHAALAAARRALRPGGRFAVWSEEADSRFARRMEQSGFTVDVRREGRGGRRHVIYVGSVGAGNGGRDATLPRGLQEPKRRGR